MGSFLLLSQGLNLLWVIIGAFAGVLFAVYTLRYLDYRVGLEFKERVVPLLERNGQGAGIYFGLRFLGICILVGLVISAALG